MKKIKVTGINIYPAPYGKVHVCITYEGKHGITFEVSDLVTKTNLIKYFLEADQNEAWEQARLTLVLFIFDRKNIEAEKIEFL
jgi:hypothetical protein